MERRRIAGRWSDPRTSRQLCGRCSPRMLRIVLSLSASGRRLALTPSPQPARSGPGRGARRPDTLKDARQGTRSDPRRAAQDAGERGQAQARDRIDRRRPAQAQPAAHRYRRARRQRRGRGSPRPRSASSRSTSSEAGAAQIAGAAARRHRRGAGGAAAHRPAGRRPPSWCRPEDALQAVRSAMMLGAVLPEMRMQAEALAADLAELVRLRKQIAERARPASAATSLALARRPPAPVAADRASARSAGGRREGARRRAPARRRAGPPGRRSQGADRQARAGPRTAPGTAPRGGSQRRAQGAGRPARPGRAQGPRPADPGDRVRVRQGHAAAAGQRGAEFREFGAADGLGGTEKGLSIATRPGAQVTAPCDGWVVYSGPFRNYGQLLILNAGGGYHVLLAGMERISVDLGQFVVTGEPVAVMGGGRTVGRRRRDRLSSQPVLYVEFRKDGTPVDPGPWWAATEGEKVRG